MIGETIPPARAVLLGVAGAVTKSTPISAYAKPNVRFPNSRTNTNATRRPKPVLMKPRDIKYAIAIIHTVLLPNPATAVSIGTMPNNTVSVKPIMVATKIARICHAFIETLAGLIGLLNQMIRPTNNGAIKSRYLTLFSVISIPPHTYSSFLWCHIHHGQHLGCEMLHPGTLIIW